MTEIIIPPLAPIYTEYGYDWVDPNGTVRPFSGTGNVHVKMDVKGLGLPAPALSMDKLPFDSGFIDRHAAIPARVIEATILIKTASKSDLESYVDELYGWFLTATEQRRTPGYFRVRRLDGTYRQVACYYTGGLEGDLSPAVAGEDWRIVTLELTAPDPWPSQIEDTFRSYAIGPSAQFVVINSGQLDAYPRWTIPGPFISMTFANHTIERKWTLNLTLPAGESVTVDTRPARRGQRTGPSVLDSNGIDQSEWLTAESDLWAFAPNDNSIDVALANGGITTTFDLAYLQRQRSLL